MAITYSLELALDATEVGAVAHQLLAVASGAEMVDHGLMLASGLRVFVVARSGRGGPTSVTTDFGVQPGVVVTLRLAKFDDLDVQRAQMVGLAVSLLAATPADAVLHHQFDSVWLVRRGGRLVVSDDDRWRPDLLALVPPPVVRARLAFTD